MNTLDYQLKLPTSLLRHGHVGLSQPLVLDGDFNTPSQISALVASGDCFVMLASSLDDVSDSLTADAPIAQPRLQELTASLLYLQRHYRIVPKSADYRQ